MERQRRGLTLNSSNNDGLRVTGGDDGVQVFSAGGDGVQCKWTRRSTAACQ